jgi:hypothetical protein
VKKKDCDGGKIRLKRKLGKKKSLCLKIRRRGKEKQKITGPTGTEHVRNIDE